MTRPCPECYGFGHVSDDEDRYSEARGHYTVHVGVTCEACDGTGELEGDDE